MVGYSTLIQKVSKTTGEIVFEVNIRGSEVNFVYRGDSNSLLTVSFPAIVLPETWTYIAIQVSVMIWQTILCF